ncbi:unnamed protein product [Trichobilharzia regenti]|nr:unnamed protein product [Trichobilharzia regenti]
MAFKDSPGYYSSQSMASMTTGMDKKRLKGSFDESVYQKQNYLSSALSPSSQPSSSFVKDKSSSHSASINSDENSHLDDRQSILSDVGGGGGHIPSDSREAIKDIEDKHTTSRSGSTARSKITDTNDRGDANSGSNSARPVLEMSMYILLGLFAVVGLVFAVNCGVVVIRYRWEKKNTSKRNAGTTDDNNNTNATDYDTNNTINSCIRKKRNKSINRQTPSPSLPLTSGLLNNDDEIVDNNQIMSSMHASSSCKRMHRSKSDVENQERLLTTSNNNNSNYNNNNNKAGITNGKRTKRSATSMFTSRQKHKVRYFFKICKWLKVCFSKF